MSVLSILIFILIIVFLLKVKSENSPNGTFSKLGKFILLFIGCFIVYYFIIGILSMFVLYYFSASTNAGSDSGLWAYGIIASIILSPLLSLITTIKLINKK